MVVAGFSAAEKVLRRAPFLIDQTKQDAATALHVAASDGHVDMAKILITASLNVTSNTFYKYGSLTLANVV